MHKFVLSTILLVLLATVVGAGSGAADLFAVRSLDGSNNTPTTSSCRRSASGWIRIAAIRRA